MKRGKIIGRIFGVVVICLATNMLPPSNLSRSCSATSANSQAFYSETLEIYQYKIGQTISWTHTYDNSVQPIEWATLTIVADDVDDREDDEVYFNGHFLGYLNNQGYYSNWGYTPGPGATGNSSLTTTVFELDPNWIQADNPTSVVVEPAWGVEIETSSLAIGGSQCTNEVPLFKQCDEPWSGDPYDHIATTICGSGCALTSAVMILNYYGVQANPRDLNDWLKKQFIDRNQNGVWDPGEPSYGYDSSGGVNWQAVAQYSGGVVSYYGWAARDSQDSTLNSDLCSGRPVILSVPGHFVVATGQTRVNEIDTWSINDPGFNRTTLLDYSNSYSSMRRFGPRRADNSAIIVRAHSPVELFVTDPQGRSLGIDPETGREIHGIPDANYYHEGSIPGVSETKVIEILNPIDGDYTIKVVGTDTGSYTLYFEGYFESGSLGNLQVMTGQIASGEVHGYEINYTSVPYEVFLPIVMANR